MVSLAASLVRHVAVTALHPQALVSIVDVDADVAVVAVGGAVVVPHEAAVALLVGVVVVALGGRWVAQADPHVAVVVGTWEMKIYHISWW